MTLLFNLPVKRFALATIALWQVSQAFSQGGLAAYTDFRNRFYIFDNGTKKLAEEQPVKSFKVGGSHVAYVDYADNFKVYSKGEIKKLEIGRVEEYFVSDYLVAYTMVNMLKVYDQGKPRTVSTSTTDFTVGDSLIVFFDTYYNTINGYYNGQIYSRRLRLVSSKVDVMTVVRNIGAAVISEDRSFWIFYRGNTQMISELVTGVNFSLGRDIMAYVDVPTQTFKAFYKGEIYDLESFQPASFKAGDGRVAYVDNVGNFKTFYDGKIATISSTKPAFYEVRDSIIVYGEVGRLKCFYNERITEIVPYIPDRYVFGRNQVLYVDNNRNINLFRNGVSRVIYMGGSGMINELSLERDVVVLNVDLNRTLLIYNGKVY